jgi:hypothetical protein
VFINPEEFHAFMAGQIWKQTLTAIISYAVNFRDGGDNTVPEEEQQKEIHERIGACHLRVKGNRKDDQPMSEGDRALVFEAVLKEALTVMGVPVS